jgi:competence protein ComER
LFFIGGNALNIGIIGTGNMGTMIIESFIESSAVTPSQLTIMNRTREKAERLRDVYPGIKVVDNPDEVVKTADYIFICVKPLEIQPLLQSLKKELTERHCVISITSPISVEQLESIVHCSVARVIPSINNRALSGTSLLTFGGNCRSDHSSKIRTLMEKVSTPIDIEENVTRIASDITSCAPAFFSYLVQRFIEAAVEETEITKEQAILLASKMLIGMGNLLEKEVYTLPTLQEKVCVKGGVTGEGIKVLESEVGFLFNHLIQSTHAKYHEDREKVGEQFASYTK